MFLINCGKIAWMPYKNYEHFFFFNFGNITYLQKIVLKNEWQISFFFLEIFRFTYWFFVNFLHQFLDILNLSKVIFFFGEFSTFSIIFSAIFRYSEFFDIINFFLAILWHSEIWNLTLWKKITGKITKKINNSSIFKSSKCREIARKRTTK